MFEAASFVLYFNQGKYFVIRDNSGENQVIVFTILARYPVKRVTCIPFKNKTFSNTFEE
jgi:hypothetical protein